MISISKADFILAADPSLNGFGYAVIDIRYKEPKIAEKGTILGRNKTWGDTPRQVKLALISSKIRELVAKYQPLHKKVFVESGFTKFNKETQALYAARGAFESELSSYDIVEFSPNTIKKEIGRHGHANKKVVADNLCKIFNVELDYFETDNESDAVAVGYLGFQHIK